MSLPKNILGVADDNTRVLYAMVDKDGNASTGDSAIDVLFDFRDGTQFFYVGSSLQHCENVIKHLKEKGLCK